MIPRLLVIAFGVVPLSACATFTDDNVAARVGDAELSYDDFERRVRLLDDSELDAIPGDLGRAVVANWVALEIARPSGLIDRYEAGPLESGLLCVSAVGAPDQASADAAVADLRAGADWSEFVAEIEPLAPLSGRQSCIATAVVGAIADQLADVGPDNPYHALTFPDATVAVIRVQPVDELSGFELLGVAQGLDAALVDDIVASVPDTDVYVDPRLGRFDTEQFSVVPLG